ncbi:MULTISPECIES: carboxypeptidase-like regulatory domain-containing protein [Croceitalea]|uniref:Carboxypeptidase-like regulatory domain-containing protein n=1 Tax=Croceitalea vernalis TaxID=3075599 RepID=A0ABU3BGN9_9FLAO|nr:MULTISPECIES: carboxypeptidase-like regulatory domain-containing protein [unclassified Croceitalea]MDT0539542.1 carboxypeptidase-like regulatory domain-containing protein [Croceitalea sp. P059]MDT0621334.1 carboxypeptidase-like regulatory domain-containing protein [Croceitalea sp. P007]
MKNLLSILFSFFLLNALTAQEKHKIFGKVSDGKNPIANVNVRIANNDSSTITDSDGNYEIMAGTGDILEFTYTGLRTVSIRVEDVTKILNPIMIPDVTELDEVEVTASKRRSQKDMEEDYVTNKSIIRTAWGLLDAERAAGNIRILAEDQISPGHLCLLDLLAGEFAGVSVSGTCNGLGGAVSIRGPISISNSTPAIYDIDGQIFTDYPWWLDINNIKRVAILANLATTATYGSLGKSGVVVINTVGGNPKVDQFVDRARLRNNYADDKTLSRAEAAENAPSYLKELMNSESFEASKAIFEKHHKVYSNSPYFLLDAYTHFADTYDEMEYADSIIESHFATYTNNPVLLKALAYIYESQQRFEKANAAYKEVFILRPNYAQSYMDMANSYRNLREPQQAASMYARYEYLIQEGFLEQDTIGFGPIVEREYNNLLMLEKGAVVKGRKAQKLFVAEEDFKGTRLVFEWNDGEAEFDLQFVNPENQYHKWKHSMFDNVEVIEREKSFGYNANEYLIDDSLPGTWQVNVNYLGNKSLSPTYLKATVYYDYGSRNQRKEVKVFKLSLKNVNQELFNLQAGNKIAVR